MEELFQHPAKLLSNPNANALWGSRKIPSMEFFSSQGENAIVSLLTFLITYGDRKGWGIPVPLGYVDFSRCLYGIMVKTLSGSNHQLTTEMHPLYVIDRMLARAGRGSRVAITFLPLIWRAFQL